MSIECLNLHCAASIVTVQPLLPFPGSAAILAAILAGGTPALPGGLNGYPVLTEGMYVTGILHRGMAESTKVNE